jgi:hypothetical protein
VARVRVEVVAKFRQLGRGRAVLVVAWLRRVGIRERVLDPRNRLIETLGERLAPERRRARKRERPEAGRIGIRAHMSHRHLRAHI